MRVDATRRLAPLAITRDAALEEMCDANGALLRAARDVVARLSDQLLGSGYVIVLTDATGCILQIVGDRAIQRRLARIDFVAGGDWSEAAAGTNAIGTALSDGRAVQLLAAEHFCDGWTDLTCTAVPIRDPFSGTIIGAIDLTGNYRLIRAHLTNLLAIGVLEIEERLRRLHDPTSEARIAHAAIRTRVDDDVFLTFASGAMAASLDLATTLRTVCEQTEHVLDARTTAVFLFATESEAPYPHVWSQSCGRRDEALAALLADSDAVAVLRERGEPILIDDVTTAPFLGPRICDGPFGSIALLPLPTARGTIGFVAAARTIAAPWNFVDVRRASALMTGAATAIENARLFDALSQRNRHIETINATARLLCEILEPADHLHEILEAIAAEVGYGAAVLSLRRTDYGPLQDVARVGGCDPSRRCTASHVTVGLSAGAATVGMLELCGGTTARGDRGDRATIVAVAQQLAMALNNAQLIRTAGEVEVLRRTDRLKSEFLATVSHDLRSPLTAICAGIDGILDRPDHVTRDDGYLHTIRNQANRLGRLVDRLLDISQIESGALRLCCEWHDFQSILDDVLDGIEPLYGPRNIVLDVPSPHPLLFVDRDRIVQVFYNLIDNACKYSPARSPIAIDATWTARAITIGITDRGSGIPPHEREQIFARFYRGQNALETTRSIGIGLAICRGIVEAHGGTIWLEQPSALGSTFRFSLPLRTDFGRELP
ncbi:MAG: ATP-binding protein [Vulcanimicrobiaceae bacterium]